MISSILVLDYALRLKILHTIPTRIPKQSEFRSEFLKTGREMIFFSADEIIKILKENNLSEKAAYRKLL
jgi:hypothetical protein